MPRRKVQRQFKQVDDFVRGQIIGAKKFGASYRQISSFVGHSLSTVHHVWNRWIVDGQKSRKKGAGRKKMITEDRHLYRLAITDRQATSTELSKLWNECIVVPRCGSTVRRRLISSGLRACHPMLSLPLTPIHRRLRYDWCKNRVFWNNEWTRIVFSDGSRFCLFKNDGRTLVRRRCNERESEECIVKRHTASTRGIMVWGAISYNSKSPLVRFRGIMNALNYISDVLEPVAIPFLNSLPDAIFQQDNARPHTARVVRSFFNENNVNLSDWPARSPDLPPIENVWDYVGRKISNSRRRITNEEQLWVAVERAWNDVSQGTIRNLFDSMQRRVRMVLKVRGRGINY